jgi:hypothetical protein
MYFNIHKLYTFEEICKYYILDSTIKEYSLGIIIGIRNNIYHLFVKSNSNGLPYITYNYITCNRNKYKIYDTIRRDKPKIKL